MSKPEIDWDEVYGTTFGRTSDQHDDDGLRAIVKKIQDDAYEAGRRDVLREGAARTTALIAQATYLDEADNAPSSTHRAVALIIADAFGRVAETYRNGQRPTLDPSVGLCGSSQPHDQHRFDEDYVDGKLTSWRTCQGIAAS